MARGRIVQNSWVGGEIAPELHGRWDIAAYFKGAAKIENFIVKKTGGVVKRPGVALGHKVPLARVQSVAGAEGLIKILPYKQDTNNAGVVVLEREQRGEPDEWGMYELVTVAYYIPIERLWDTGLEINKIDLPQLDLFSGAGLDYQQVGDTFYISDVGGSSDTDVMITLTVHPYSGTLAVGTLQPSVAPGAPYNMSITLTGGVWKEKDPLKTYKYAAYTRRGGVLSAPNKISKTADAGWPEGGGIRVTMRVNEPWPDEVILAKQGGAAYGAIFTVDGESHTSSGNTAGVPYRSYQFTDENHIPGEVMTLQTDLFEGAAPMASHVTVWQQRLVLAGLPGEPFSIAFSKAGDFGGFVANRPVADDDPFRLTLPTESYDRIRHVVAFRDVLLVFGDGGVWRIYASSQAEGVGPRTTRVEQINSIGCAAGIKPLKVGLGVVYVGVDRRTVYQMMYNLEQDMIVPAEVSVLARHLTEGEGRQIKQMAYQTYPESLVWFLLDDGNLLTMTVQNEHEIVAWSRHGLPGRVAVRRPGEEPYEVELVVAQIVACESMSVAGVSDVVLLLVDAVSEAAAEEEGDEIGVWIGVLRQGATKDYAGSEWPQEIAAELVTLRPDAQDRSIQGLVKNVTDCVLRLKETDKLAVVSGAGGVDEVVAVDEGATAYSGDVKVMPRGVLNTDGQMRLVSERGRCEILSAIWELEV